MHQSGQITIIPKHELKRFGEGISLTFHIISGDQPAGKGRFNFCRINTKNNKIYIPREATTLHFLGGCFTRMLRALPTYMFWKAFLGSYVPYQKLHSVNIAHRGPISGGVSEMKVLSSVVFSIERRRSTGVPWYGLDGWNPKQPLGMDKTLETNGTNYLSTGAEFLPSTVWISLPCGLKDALSLTKLQGTRTGVPLTVYPWYLYRDL